MGFRYSARRGGIADAVPKERLHSLKKRLRFQHHAFAAAERPVVHGAVAIFGKVAQVLHVNFDDSRFARAADNPVIERTVEELGENRNQIEAHAKLV